MVQKLHTFEMSKGKPQRITHLRNSFQLHTVSCITNIQQLSAPFRYFSAKHETFSFEMGRKKCTFSLASTQTNLITFQMDTILNRKPAWVVRLELQQAAPLFLSNWNLPTLLSFRAAGSATNQTNEKRRDLAVNGHLQISIQVFWSHLWGITPERNSPAKDMLTDVCKKKKKKIGVF